MGPLAERQEGRQGTLRTTDRKAKDKEKVRCKAMKAGAVTWDLRNVGPLVELGNGTAETTKASRRQIREETKMVMENAQDGS